MPGLTVSRRPGEQLLLSGGITITIVSVDRNKVLVRVEAPAEVRVDRAERLARQGQPPLAPTRGAGGQAVLSVAQQQDWRTVLTVGVLPHAATEGLESLAGALRRGDPRLLRRHITEPPDLPMPCVESCPLAWLSWRGEPGVTVGDVHAAWSALLGRCAEATGSKLAVKSFLDAWDGWADGGYGAKPLAAGELLEVVHAELARRAAVEVVS